MAKIIAKIGVFINDRGGRLSGSLDPVALAEKTEKIKGVKHAQVVTELTPESTTDVVVEKFKAEELDRVLWVGSFPDAFRAEALRSLAEAGLNPYLHEWFDPADQGLLNPDLDDKVREKKLTALMKMTVARTKALAALEPEELPANERTVIVGGGVTGLHTATALIKAGKPVTLVEQNSGLGGNVAKLARFYPLMCDPRCGLEHVLFDLMDSDLLDLRSLSKVEDVCGSPGSFDVTVRSAPRYVNEQCDGCGKCEAACPVVLDDTVPQPQAVLPPEVLEKLWTGESHDCRNQEGETAEEGAKAPEAEENLQELLGSAPEVPPAKRPARFQRKAIHPAYPMPQPVTYVLEREHCGDGCQICAEVCPNNAIDFSQQETVETTKAGAVIGATGWDLYEMERVEGYAFGSETAVISSLEMERMLSADDQHTTRLEGFSPSDVQTVGFIQCAGSRDEKHLDYCSGVCCSATLKQILDLRRQNPEVQCFVYYMHIRTPGFDERMYREVRNLGNVVFIHERPAQVKFDADGKVVIDSLDEILGKRVRTKLDLLVLAGGMKPSDGGKEIGRIFKAPMDRYGFFETHRQCYPAETQRTGIFVAGCAREPMNVSQSVESGVSSAMRAMPFLKGTVKIDPTYPDISAKKCDSCGRCVEECPFQVLTFDEKEIPVPDLSKCRQCGNCMGVCPKTAVNLRNSTIKQYAIQIETLSSNTFLPKKEPIIFAFLCENDAWPAHREAQKQNLVPEGVVAVSVTCAGAVNNALIADALSYGIDGVFIGACPDGTCHYVRGNELIAKRRDDLADKLKNMSMEPERVAIAGLGPRDVKEYVEALQECIALLKEKGPNPFKM